MTKKLKQIFTLILALTVVFAVSVTAFAETPVPPYTITINNNSSTVSMKDITYSAYKIFDVTMSGGDETPTNYAYTISQNFSDFSYTYGSNTYTGKTLVEYVETLNDDSTELNSFAKAVRQYVIDNSITADDTVVATAENTAVLKVQDLGYYIVMQSAKTVDSSGTEEVTAFCAITTTNYNAEINLKVDVPTITKGVKEDGETAYASWSDGELNEKFNFMLTCTIPSYVDFYENYTYIIHDRADSTLVLDESSVTVYSDEALTTEIENTNYALKTTDTTDNCTFEVSMNNDYIKANAGKTIYVCYDAVLGTDAGIYTDSNNNAAHIEYSNTPYATTTTNTPDKTVKVYSYSFELFKYYEDDKTQKKGLANAHYLIPVIPWRRLFLTTILLLQVIVHKSSGTAQI